MRKKIMICCIVIGLISFTACGNTSNSISARQAKAKQQEGQAADMDIKDKKTESAYTVDVVDDLQITVPSEWVTLGQSYYKNGKAQVYIETFDFELEKLMKEFDYEDEKSCLKEFFYNGSEADEGIEYTKQKLVMPSYQFRMVADKYYKGCNGKAVENTEPIIVQALVNNKSKKVYMFYFTNEMSDEGKVDDFLSKITLFDEKNFYNEESGLYRWQNGAEIYSD